MTAPRRSYTVFRHRDFRLLAAGRFVSQIGTWAQYVGVGWAARDLSGSSLVVGGAVAAQFTPSLLISPVAGVLADRFDRRRVVIVGNLAMMLPALAIGLIIHSGSLSVASLLALVFLGGVGYAFTQPAAMTLVPAVVPSADVHHAIAVNSVVVNLTRIFGPAIGGAAIGAWGLEYGFYLNALSFLAVVVACSMIGTLPPPPGPSDDEGILAQLRAGGRYAYSHGVVGSLLTVTLIVTLCAMHGPLLPILARDVLHGDVRTYAWLALAPGIGAVAGAAVAGEIGSEVGRRRVIRVAVLLIGGGLTTLAVSRVTALSMVALVVFGFGYFLQSAVIMSTLMQVSSEEMRGRVMGLWHVIAAGFVPVSALLAGALAMGFGAPATVGLGGVAVLALATRAARNVVKADEGRNPDAGSDLQGAW